MEHKNWVENVQGPIQIINYLSTKIELLSPISFSLHGLNLVLPIISGLSYDPCSPLTKLSELYKKALYSHKMDYRNQKPTMPADTFSLVKIWIKHGEHISTHSNLANFSKNSTPMQIQLTLISL